MFSGLVLYYGQTSMMENIYIMYANICNGESLKGFEVFDVFVLQMYLFFPTDTYRKCLCFQFMERNI